MQASPIKWPPAEPEKPAVFCCQLFLLPYGPFLISLVFFHPSSTHAKLATESTAAPSFYSPFVCFTSIPYSQPLPPVFFPSSSRSVIHHRLALCQSVMHISRLLTVNEIHPLFLIFLSAPEFHAHFYHSQHSSLSCLRLTAVVIYSSCLCAALWEFVRTQFTYD